jgi:hypothetical protein
MYGDVEMANGVNHAKKIVIDEAEGLADQLQNGAAGDTQVQGKAIGLIVKMITPLYEADFVTVETCAATRSQCNESIISKIDEAIENGKLRTEELIDPKNMSKAALKLGPLELKGGVVPMASILVAFLSPVAGMVFLIGKFEGWW